MKYSMKKIFSHLKSYLLFIFFITLITLGIIFEHQLSFDKYNNLTEQKKILASLVHFNQQGERDLELIEFNSKSVQLLQLVDKLHLLTKYNFTDKYLLRNDAEYQHDIETLRSLIFKFNNIAKHFYSQEDETTKVALLAKEQMLQSYHETIHFIDEMIFTNVLYNQQKYTYLKYLAIVIFILITFATIWYRHMISKITQDIDYLHDVNKRSDYKIFTIEADALALRMNRKGSSASTNPNDIDQVTGINNYKGLLTEYSQKKGVKNSYFTSVTVIEIDNFSKTNRVFPQEVAQAILKKIAYTLSLHQQPIDVIARTDYNQFTIILARPSKEQTFKDIELIRESIAELKFNLADKGQIKITISGGHIIKPNNASLEEAIKQAKEILAHAKTTGKNKILQIRDIAQHDLHV